MVVTSESEVRTVKVHKLMTSKAWTVNVGQLRFPNIFTLDLTANLIVTAVHFSDQSETSNRYADYETVSEVNYLSKELFLKPLILCFGLACRCQPDTSSVECWLVHSSLGQ